jgi:hypothetical protein
MGVRNRDLGWRLLLLMVIALVAGPVRAATAGPAADKPAAQKPATQKPAGGPKAPAAPEPEPEPDTAAATEPPAAPDPGATSPGKEGDPAKPKAQGVKPSKGPAGPDSSGIDPFAGGTPDVRQSEIYGDRLDGLQNEVETLKDKIFRSKARLTLLKETVLRGVLAGSRVIIAHRNLMGSGFRLVRIVYLMDGAQIYARTDETGGLDSEDELVIYDGNLPPGPHNVTVEALYRGHGYGVFSYLSQYTFESRNSHSFTAPENGAIKVSSVGFESGNITTEMRDRPSFQWQELPLDASGRPLPTTRKRKRTGRGSK